MQPVSGCCQDATFVLTMVANFDEVRPGMIGVTVVHRAHCTPLKPNLNA